MQIVLGSVRLAVLVMAVVTLGVVAAEAGHPTTLVERRLDGWMSRLLHYEHGRAATSYPASPSVTRGTSSSGYRWGWFGTQHAGPRTHTHRGYNNDFWSWEVGRRHCWRAISEARH